MIEQIITTNIVPETETGRIFGVQSGRVNSAFERVCAAATDRVALREGRLTIEECAERAKIRGDVQRESPEADYRV